MADATIRFHLTIRNDDGEERSTIVVVECAGSGLPETLRQRRSVSGVDALHAASEIAPVLASMVEAACATAGAVPLNHHDAIASALDGGHGSHEATPGSRPVRMLGSEPLRFPDVGSLSGKKKARTVAETPPVPGPDDLTDIGRAAQPALRELVEAAGGRFGLRGPGNMVDEGHTDLFVDVMNEWASHYGTRRGNRIELSRPGLWHALDRLYPLQDPNRLDRLRKAVTRELERQGWRRNGTRSAKWWIQP